MLIWIDLSYVTKLGALETPWESLLQPDYCFKAEKKVRPENYWVTLLLCSYQKIEIIYNKVVIR